MIAFHKNIYEKSFIQQTLYTPALFNFLLLTEGFELIKHRNALYKKEIFKFQYKNNQIKYYQLLIKRLVWVIFPYLMKIKPNTYTVLTK